MNHFVYNWLNALSYQISKESFKVSKKWYQLGLFNEVIAIFSLPSFKKLPKEQKMKIYHKINELRDEETPLEDKRKWLMVCKEQLESTILLEQDMVLKRKK